MQKKQTENKRHNFINKILICMIIFLGLAIICKSNSTYKEKIYNYIYKTNIDFSTFKQIYNKYLGGVSSIKENTNQNESYVFNEKIKYSSITPYEDGAKLEVNNNYLVPNLEKGIVVYIGEKDKYQTVVMVENEEGIDTWYGNICNSSLKLYDNIDTTNYIGESCNNYIYLVFTKENTFLDYKQYLN